MIAANDAPPLPSTRERITGVYTIAAAAEDIEIRARNLAIEQSVEMPLDAIDDETVLADIVGRVESIEAAAPGFYRVRVGLAATTIGAETGQLMNMLFGNSSLHDFVTLDDVDMPPAFVEAFGGPHHGAQGLKSRVGAQTRAITCAALKPQGLSPDRLSGLAGRLAAGGIDYIKDDHGLADQTYSPFAARVAACADAVRRASQATGHLTRYVPNLSGDLDRLRAQLRIVREEGIDTVLIAPMVVGLPAFHTLTREHTDVAFIAHPALGGAARIAPPLLFGKLFRLLGADATIFPSHGGRFGYSPQTCSAIADHARQRWHGLKPSMPVPAGGMTLDRLPALIDFYGTETMILIGGGLLAARDHLTAKTAAFVAEVAKRGVAGHTRP